MLIMNGICLMTFSSNEKQRSNLQITETHGRQSTLCTTQVMLVGGTEDFGRRGEDSKDVVL